MLVTLIVVIVLLLLVLLVILANTVVANILVATAIMFVVSNANCSDTLIIVANAISSVMTVRDVK